MGSHRLTGDAPRTRRVEIPMSDGVVLAGLLWLPEGRVPAPVVLSLNPYRNDYLDGLLLDHANAFFAAHGYAALLVDFRGSGDSQGDLALAVGRREGADGADVVEWAASQSWCDGNVGIWGMSWLGIAALWTAAERPPHLRAVAALMSPTRMLDDYQRPGGAELLTAEPVTAANMLALQMIPPLAGMDTGAWLDRWMARLRRLQPFGLSWRATATPDPAAPSGDSFLERIDTPTFLIGGWHDIAVEGTIRAFERLRVPRRLLMGPWAHTYPDAADREPVDHVRELLGWWDCWLKRSDDGLVKTPPVTYFAQGRDEWRASPGWPPPVGLKSCWLGPAGSLRSQPSAAGRIVHRIDPTVGIASDRWRFDILPGDQSDDDVRSLCFITLVDDRWLEIAGRPRLVLHIDPDVRGDLQIVARLCDVAPSGRSRLITTGQRRILSNGRSSAVEIALTPTMYCVAPGHRLRLAISSGDFPFLRPAGHSRAIRVAFGGDRPSLLELPVVVDSSFSSKIHAPPVPGPEVRCRAILEADGSTRVDRRFETGKTTVLQTGRLTLLTREGTRLNADVSLSAEIDAADPGAAMADTRICVASVGPLGKLFVVSTYAHTIAGETVLEGAADLDGSRLIAVGWRADRHGIREMPGTGSAARLVDEVTASLSAEANDR